MQSGASHADQPLSCSCLVQKRKNFVSRARTTPLAGPVFRPASAVPAPTLGYVRVSTDKQAEHGVSLEAQVEKIRAMATVHDVELFMNGCIRPRLAVE